MSLNTISPAAKPRCNGPFTPAKCLSGVSVINIAVMNEAKSPTVTLPSFACSKAIMIMTETANEVANCVIGSVVAMVLAMRMVNPRKREER